MSKWETKTIKEITNFMTDGNWIESKDQSADGIRLIQTGNIGQGVYLDKTKNSKFISNDTFSKLACTEIFAGDILVSRLPDPVGRACIIPPQHGIMITAVDCSVLRLKIEMCDTKYFVYFTQSQQYLNQIKPYISGTTRDRISRKNLEKILVPLPLLEKQQRIVDILDRASQLIDLRKQQIEKMDLMIKSQFVEMFGDPKDNFKQWPVYNLQELCKVGSSKRLYQNEQTAEGIPFLRISDLMQRIETGKEDCNLFIPVERYEELKSQDLVPTVGDILVTSRGTLGACYIVKDTDSFYFQDGMISWLYEIEKSILPLYISYLFATQSFHKQIDRLQAGSTVAYLSISMLKKLKIMLPPHDIQTQFAVLVQQVDKSKFAMNQSLKRLEQCRNALMQEAFG